MSHKKIQPVDLELGRPEGGNLSPPWSTPPTPVQVHVNNPASSSLCGKLLEHVFHALVYFQNHIVLFSLKPYYLRNLQLVRKDAGQVRTNEANLVIDTATKHTKKFFILYTLSFLCAAELPLFAVV